MSIAQEGAAADFRLVLRNLKRQFRFLLEWSNEDRTGVEQTRTLFDLMRVAFASTLNLRTDLSRRLRDGVYLPPSHVTHSTSDEMTDLAVVPMSDK